MKPSTDTMRFFTTLIVSFFLTAFTAYSASISGTVLDAVSGKPLEFASVFISGTTFGTNTRSDGTFTLTFTPSGSSQLVIAYLGYETFTKNVSELPTDQSLRVGMTVKSVQIASVNVFAKDSNRKKNMAEFLFGFFGDSEFGKQCSIRNPHVLHLMRKPVPGKIGQDQLVATADSDLYIDNKLLGYTIRYTLESFVQSKYAISFKGYPLYIDNLSGNKNKEKTLAYRERAYLGSQMHFFRSLYNKTLELEGFKVYKVDKAQILPMTSGRFGLLTDSVFVPEPNKRMMQTEKPLNLYEYMFQMDKSAALLYNEPFEVRYTLNGEDKAYGKNSIYYIGMTRTLGQQTSLAMLENNSVIFYPNGACKNAGSLTTIGYWSFKKAAEIMPWDYQPAKTAKEVVTLRKL
jgi:hypothetical protein